MTQSAPTMIDDAARERDVPPVGRRTRRVRPQDVDRLVGARIRARRVMLGITLQELAEAIGVTYQQANKYERGTNRVAAGRLAAIASALGAPVNSFFDGLEEAPAKAPSSEQRMLLELARNFLALPTRRHQESICAVVRALAEPPGATGGATESQHRAATSSGSGPRARSGGTVRRSFAAAE